MFYCWCEEYEDDEVVEFEGVVECGKVKGFVVVVCECVFGGVRYVV